LYLCKIIIASRNPLLAKEGWQPQADGVVDMIERPTTSPETYGFGYSSFARRRFFDAI
jgi:hypothetical protein